MMLIHMLNNSSLENLRNVAEARLEKTEDFKETLRLGRTIYGLDNKIVQNLKRNV